MKQAGRTVSTDRSVATSNFDLNDLRSDSVIERLVQWLFDDPQAVWVFGLLRRFRPIVREPFSKLTFVTRWDDVREVLAQDDVFVVPFGDKVKELNGGPNFLLGMQADPVYWQYQQQVMRAFRFDDVASIVTPLAAEFAKEIIDRSDGRLDVVQDYITRVPSLICRSYYGIELAPEDMLDFGHWTIAMSTYMFGDPTDKPAYRRVAVAAGDRLRPLVDRSIANAKAAAPGTDTVLNRLIAMQKEGADGLTDDIIRAYLVGMITGFVPTNTMAAGHILEMLLRRPDFMAAARNAALAGDDDLLERCLFEAMRFKPLNPGPFRNCARDYTIAKGTRRARTIRPGMKLLVSTQSAMFDKRQVERPREFNPNRPQSDYMLFGYGLHWCAGAFIARAHITQAFKALLVLKGLRRASGPAGQLRLLGPFPEHLVVEFDR